MTTPILLGERGAHGLPAFVTTLRRCLNTHTAGLGHSRPGDSLSHKLEQKYLGVKLLLRCGLTGPEFMQLSL